MAIKKNILFEFNYWTRYHFIALAVPICCMLTTYLQKNELKYYNDEIMPKKENGQKKIREFPYFFNIFISKILSIIFVLISKYTIKHKSSKNLELKENTITRRYHLDYNNNQRKIKAAFLIIGISILELIFKIEGYLTIGKPNYIELKLGFLLLVPVLSVFILKKKLFKHHYLSFSISFLAFILVCTSSFFYKNRPETLEQLRHLCFSIPLGLAFVLIKYLYEYSFVDAYQFLFFDGILCIIIPFITIGIISIFKDSDYFVYNMKGVLYLFHDKTIILYFVFVVICSFFYYLTNAVTIYIFNPSLMVMTDILSPIFRWVIEVFKDKEYDGEDYFKYIAILKGIGFTLIIFSALVFNEILILHFCEFDNNIEANISKRADNELINNNDSRTFSLSRDDDDDDISKTKTFESELSVI